MLCAEFALVAIVRSTQTVRHSLIHPSVRLLSRLSFNHTHSVSQVRPLAPRPARCVGARQVSRLARRAGGRGRGRSRPEHGSSPIPHRSSSPRPSLQLLSSFRFSPSTPLRLLATTGKDRQRRASDRRAGVRNDIDRVELPRRATPNVDRHPLPTRFGCISSSSASRSKCYRALSIELRDPSNDCGHAEIHLFSRRS